MKDRRLTVWSGGEVEHAHAALELTRLLPPVVRAGLTNVLGAGLPEPPYGAPREFVIFRAGRVVGSTIDEMHNRDLAPCRTHRLQLLVIGIVAKLRRHLLEQPPQRLTERFQLSNAIGVESRLARILDVLRAL